MLSFSKSDGFSFSDELSDAIIKLDDMVDMYKAGHMSKKTFEANCIQYAEKFPGLIEAPYNRGIVAFENGKLKDARVHAEAAIAIAEAVMPAGFTGKLSWYQHHNRPYIRALHLKALCEMNSRDNRGALATCQKAYKLCPDDGIGFRFLIGKLLLQTGDFPGALEHLAKLEASDPSVDYQLALAAFRMNQFDKAAYHLRRGIVACTYFAEALLGQEKIHPRLMFHGSNLIWPSAAVQHASDVRNIWTPQGEAFIAYILNHPATLADRAAVAQVRHDHYVHGHAWEHDKVLAAITLKDCKGMVAPLVVESRRPNGARAALPWQIAEEFEDGSLHMPRVVQKDEH